MADSDNTRPRAVVYGPRAFRVVQSIVRGFENLSWNADGIEFLNATPGRLLRFSGLASEMARRRRFNRTFRQVVLPTVRCRHCDLLLVLKGAAPEPDNVASIKDLNVPVVHWATDSVSRFPGQQKFAAYASLNLVLDQGDVRDERSVWLPLGYDDRVFVPRARDSSAIDLLLAGQLGPTYQERLRCVRMIAESELPNRYRVCLSALTPHRLSHFLLTRNKRVMWLSGRLEIHNLASLIANTRVCVNVHQDDGISPVNPMFFAIAGAGSCQVAQGYPHLSKWLSPNQEFIPFERDNLLTVLRTLLGDKAKTRTVTADGLRRASAEHTFTARVKRIIELLGIRSDSARVEK